jgi:hypothetical protein
VTFPAVTVVVGEAVFVADGVKVAAGKEGVSVATGVDPLCVAVADGATVEVAMLASTTDSSFDKLLSIPVASQPVSANEWLTPICKPVTTYPIVPLPFCSKPTRSVPVPYDWLPSRV